MQCPVRGRGGAVRHRHSGHSLLTRKVSAWDVGGAKSGDVTLQMGERGCACTGHQALALSCGTRRARVQI